MRFAVRALLILFTFVAVGYGTMHWLIARAVSHGTPEYQVRMGGALGGLFAGGIAATLVLLALLLGRKRPHLPPEPTEDEHDASV